jgi:hypothetical protein
MAALATLPILGHSAIRIDEDPSCRYDDRNAGLHTLFHVYFDFPHPGTAIKRIFEYAVYGSIVDESFLWNLLEPLEQNITAYSFLDGVRYTVVDSSNPGGAAGGSSKPGADLHGRFEDEYYVDDAGGIEYYDENHEDDYYEDDLPEGTTTTHNARGVGDDEYYEDTHDGDGGEYVYYDDGDDDEEEKVLCTESFFDDATQTEHVETEVWVVHLENGKRVYYNKESDTAQWRHPCLDQQTKSSLAQAALSERLQHDEQQWVRESVFKFKGIWDHLTLVKGCLPRENVKLPKEDLLRIVATHIRMWEPRLTGLPIWKVDRVVVEKAGRARTILERVLGNAEFNLRCTCFVCCCCFHRMASVYLTLTSR